MNWKIRDVYVLSTITSSVSSFQIKGFECSSETILTETVTESFPLSSVQKYAISEYLDLHLAAFILQIQMISRTFTCFLPQIHSDSLLGGWAEAFWTRLMHYESCSSAHWILQSCGMPRTWRFQKRRHLPGTRH